MPIHIAFWSRSFAQLVPPGRSSPIRQFANKDDVGRIYPSASNTRKTLAAFVAVALLVASPACRPRAEGPTATPIGSLARSPTVVQSTIPPATPSAVGSTPVPARSSLDAQLDQIERRVEEVRGLRPEGETKRRFVDAPALAEVINRELDKPDNQKQIAREQKLYRLLGLIGPNDDLDRLYRGLLGSQVLGLYDSETEEFLVLHAGGDLTALAESTYAHEYTHRLQDIRFDLDRLTDETRDNSDRQTALAALIEGDATVTQLGYGLRYMGRARLAELMRAPEQFSGPPPGTPFVLLEGLEFPYTVGPLFVAAIRGSAPGFESVDKVFQNPPATSEQVMHPEKYRTGEGGAPVDMPGLQDVLGDGWTAGDPDVLGEFLLKTWLSFLKTVDAAAAAAGWGGDTYLLFDGPGGASALAARIVWDRPEDDAEEFFESLVAGLDRAPGMTRAGGSTPVDVVWQGSGRAIGVRLGPGGAGTYLAAAAQVDQVRRLLDRMAAP